MLDIVENERQTRDLFYSFCFCFQIIDKMTLLIRNFTLDEWKDVELVHRVWETWSFWDILPFVTVTARYLAQWTVIV